MLPYSEEYRIGDTITIKSKFSRYVWEVNLIEYIDMAGIDWNPKTKIWNMDTVNVVENNIKQDFDFIYDSEYDYDYFYYSDGGNDLYGEYNYTNDSFDLEIKIIPRKKGLFRMTQSCNLYFGVYEDHEAKCGNEGYEAYTKMNEGKDNNFHLLYESPESHFNTWIPEKPDQRFHYGGGYCFRVVE